MEIRPFQETDRASVVTLWNEVFPDQAPHNEPHGAIDRKTGVDGRLFFVAVDSNCVVGTVMGGYDGHRGWVYSLAVAPGHRRRHIGTALMCRVEEELVKRGCPKINLQVRAENDSVVAFYRQLNYEVEDRVSMGKRTSDRQQEA